MASTHPSFEVEYLPEPEDLPEELEGSSLRRRALQVGALIAVLGLIVWLAPGLGELRERLGDADYAWLAAAVALELLSCLSYVLMFKPVFCPRMSWRSAYELGMSELAMGSIVPASGAGGLALGAWALRKSGMPAEQIARQSVAFFVLKSAVNFVAVAVVGLVMFLGVGPHRTILLTLLPAVLSTLAIGGVVWLGVRRVSRPPLADAPTPEGWRRIPAAVGAALGGGLREAGLVLKRRDWRVIAGSVGYWLFDNAVLWATFRAFDASPALTLVLMGYLIGQLGGLLPIPGGIGGIDGGLIGTLIVYGLPATATVAAVLAYRVILFWLPLLLGGVAFLFLRRGLDDPGRPDLCDPLRRPRRAVRA